MIYSKHRWADFNDVTSVLGQTVRFSGVKEACPLKFNFELYG